MCSSVISEIVFVSVLRSWCWADDALDGRRCSFNPGAVDVLLATEDAARHAIVVMKRVILKERDVIQIVLEKIGKNRPAVVPSSPW